MIEIWHPEISTVRHSKAAYDIIYTGEGIRLLDSFYLWLIELMAPPSRSRLLDVSCGEGALVGFARQQEIEAYGVDFSSAAIQCARQATGHASFAVANGIALPFDDVSYDFVSCIGSLEHFADPTAANARDCACVAHDRDGVHLVAQHLQPPGKCELRAQVR